MIPKHIKRLFDMSRALWLNGKRASNGHSFADGVTENMLTDFGYRLFGNVWRR